MGKDRPGLRPTGSVVADTPTPGAPSGGVGLCARGPILVEGGAIRGDLTTRGADRRPRQPGTGRVTVTAGTVSGDRTQGGVAAGRRVPALGSATVPGRASADDLTLGDGAHGRGASASRWPGPWCRAT